MKQLKRTNYAIEVVSLSYNSPKRKGAIVSTRCEELCFSFAGVVGDTHEGELREACVRVKELHPRGTMIKNERQVTLVSEEELNVIAHRLNMTYLDEGWLGANILISGLPDVSHLPPGSRLQGPSGVTLVVDLQNHPCSIVKKTIQRATGEPILDFKAAAEGYRGITLFVERPGVLQVGDSLTLYIPTQRPWRG